MAETTRSRRVAWYLIGWIGLTALALIVTTVLYRPVDSAVRVAPRPAPVAAPSGVHLTAGGSTGWRLRYFYTAVEKYHHGPAAAVSGCPRPLCAGPPVRLGRFPRDFLALVREQGSGRLCSGPHAGGYLNWSAATGYWLDTAPRTGDGRALLRFASARSGSPQLSAGTRLRVLACGAPSRPGAQALCDRARAAGWTVAQVTPRPAPNRTLELYYGPEDRAGFAAGPWTSTFDHAVLRIG